VGGGGEHVRGCDGEELCSWRGASRAREAERNAMARAEACKRPRF
ncbi:unnamed protein product, partial [Urochloa humidicola]